MDHKTIIKDIIGEYESAEICVDALAAQATRLINTQQCLESKLFVVRGERDQLRIENERLTRLVQESMDREAEMESRLDACVAVFDKVFKHGDSFVRDTVEAFVKYVDRARGHLDEVLELIELADTDSDPDSDMEE